jgi:hypothetical protein
MGESRVVRPDALGIIFRVALKLCPPKGSEPTYHSLSSSRRLHAPPGRKGQSEFAPVCLLALKAFWILRSHDLATPDAVRAVEQAFTAMSRFVREPAQVPKLTAISRKRTKSANGSPARFD